jgi:hypothetical protein
LILSIHTCKGEEVCILQGGGNLRLTGHPLTLAQVPPHRLLHRSEHHNTQPSFNGTLDGKVTPMLLIQIWVLLSILMTIQIRMGILS